MKRFLGLILSLMMAVSLFPALPAAAARGDNDIAYAVKGGKIYFDPETGTITGGDTSISGEVIIPNEINGIAVTSIAAHAFSHADYYTLESVTIPDSVTSIGERAFYGCIALKAFYVDENNQHYTSAQGVLYSKDMTEIVKYPPGKAGTSYVVPDGVTAIGDIAFADCGLLEEIALPDGVTDIYDNAFYSCRALKSISIPSTVTAIGNYAFYKCTALTGITIPESVTTIGTNVFNQCYALESITIPHSVTSIGDYAFNSCVLLPAIDVDENNQYYTSDQGVLFTKDMSEIVKYPEGKKGTSYVVPYGVESIGKSAFESSKELESITLPDSVTAIGDSAFSYCGNLKSINIPDGVTTIGRNAFYYCHALESVNIPDGVTAIYYQTFQNCKSLQSVVIPDGVTVIYDNAFDDCASLQSVTLPDSLTSIGFAAFSGCKSLTSVTIPDGVTTIENFAFAWCESLESVTLPNSLTHIDFSSFNSCSFTSITIPPSVTEIDYGAFSFCESLQSVTIPRSVTNISSSAFSYCKAIEDVYYDGTIDEWAAISIDSENDYLINANIHYNTAALSPSEDVSSTVSTGNAEKIEATASINSSGMEIKLKAKDDSFDLSKIRCYASKRNAIKALNSQIAGDTVTFNVIAEHGTKIFVWDDNMDLLIATYEFS